MIRRGDVWWADLPDPSGSEPGYARPVVVVQADWANQGSVNTVIVVTLSTNQALAAAPGNVELSAAATGLRRTSVANVSQVITLNKNGLRDRRRTLPTSVMRAIDEGLLLVLELR